MWESHFEPIVGINIGVEYVETLEEEAWIIDFFFLRIIFYKAV